MHREVRLLVMPIQVSRGGYCRQRSKVNRFKTIAVFLAVVFFICGSSSTPVAAQFEECKGGICIRTASSDGAGKKVKRLWISGNPRPGKPLDFYQIRNIPGDIREQVKGKGGPYAYHGSGTVSIQGCYRGTFKTFCSGWVEFMIY